MIDPTGTRNCLALVTPPGLGKTEVTKDYIHQQPKERQVLVPSFRIALSEKQKADFPEFAHYLDKEAKGIPFYRMSELIRFIVQVDSIYKTIDKIDDGILFLEEWESIAEHIFSSPYIKDKTKIVNRLVEYIQSAKDVIMADANLSSASLEWS